MRAHPERRGGGQTARGGGGLNGGQTARGGGGETERGGGETAQGGGLTVRDRLNQRRALRTQCGFQAANSSSSGTSTSRERPPTQRSLAAAREARSREEATQSRSLPLPPLPETTVQSPRKSHEANDGLPEHSVAISVDPCFGSRVPRTEAMPALEGAGAIPPAGLEDFHMQTQHSFETWPERASCSSEDEPKVYLPLSQPKEVRGSCSSEDEPKVYLPLSQPKELRSSCSSEDEPKVFLPLSQPRAIPKRRDSVVQFF